MQTASLRRGTARLLLAAVVVCGFLAMVTTASAVTSAGGALQTISSKSPPPSIKKKVQRLKRDADTPRPRRGAAAKLGAAGGGKVLARASVVAQYLFKGCTYSSGNWYRTCVWTKMTGSVVDGWLVEDQSWNGRRYVAYTQFFCGVGWGTCMKVW